MEFSAIKRDELLIHATACININTMLKNSDSKEHKRLISYVWNFRKGKAIYRARKQIGGSLGPCV